MITNARTYHLTADTNEDRRYMYSTCISRHCVHASYTTREWVEFIRRIRGMSEAKVQSLMVHEVDPKNALGTIDLDNIDAVTADDQERRWVDLHNTCHTHL